jgi:predicted small lipoprotein YifL
MLPSRFPARVLLVAGILTLTLTACGRRGAPEAPPDPSAPKTEPQAPAAGPGVLPSPVGTPRSRGAKQGYTIPKEPFILDPLL